MNKELFQKMSTPKTVKTSKSEGENGILFIYCKSNINS